MKLFGKFIEPKLRYEPCSEDILVDNSHDFVEAGLDLRILHTPGHTRGSISVVVDNETAIVGDALYGTSKKSLMPPFAVDIGQIQQSWKKLLDTECSTFVPGHGDPIEASRLRQAVR